VVEVATAAEIVSAYTRQYLKNENVKKPVISSACPVVLRLICLRFPSLTENILPMLPPMEIAAMMARDKAKKEHPELKDEDIGVCFISPCPAKMPYINNPIGSRKSWVDGVISFKDIYPALCQSMKNPDKDILETAGRIGISWAISGGECAGLIHVNDYLACDGIERVIKVLEDLEDDKFENLEFVELNACDGGCVGGISTVENPYIAKTKLKRLRKYMPVSRNRLEQSIPANMLWDKHLEYQPVFEMKGSRLEKFKAYAEVEEIMERLPGLDCGSCGSPTCRCFAEDVVRGDISEDKCVVKMQEKMEKILATLMGN
jgi:iron only hydrogenase large subunit-like protein